MTPRRAALALLVTAGLSTTAGLPLAGCAGPADTVSPAATGSSPAGRADPADGVTSTTLPSPTATPSWGDQPQVVTARPGTTNPRPIAWQRAKPSPDGRSVRISFTGGVEPCSVLDHVTVSYLEQVVVTLYEGSDSRATQQPCIDLAVFKAVDVPLDEPLGGRRIVDGAPS